MSGDGGLDAMVKEVSLRPKNVQLRISEREEDGSRVQHSSFHNVLVVTLKGQQSLCIDLTGSQCGWYVDHGQF